MKSIDPKTFRDGSGYFEAETQPGRVIGKLPGGNFIPDPASGREQVFDSVNAVLAAIRAHKVAGRTAHTTSGGAA